ncbi:MAG: GNAT family N-acetyltransferase [Candidatus Krumholzibacteriota bacterium]|nr:GNAT family N-acetyltransferase [Candidatus Krumholzibacteriota bacterium]
MGTCALIACGDDVYELAKMAVLESELGRGLGDILMEATLQRARELGARRIFLLSNTSLAPAISLYLKHGFKTVRLGSHSDYDRADIEMAIDLESPPSF